VSTIEATPTQLFSLNSNSEKKHAVLLSVFHTTPLRAHHGCREKVQSPEAPGKRKSARRIA
jgi:hypothetical protein